MKKHGLSHAIGAFFSTVSSVLLYSVLKTSLPTIFVLLTEISAIVKQVVYFAPEIIISYAILASIIMFFWGIGFYLLHKD